MPPPAGKGYNRPGFKGKARRHGPPPGKGYLKEGFQGVGPLGTPGQPAARDDTSGLKPDVQAMVQKRKREADGLV